MGRITTLLEVVGLIAVAFGVGMFSHPAGVITAGAELVGASVLTARAAQPKGDR